jgi:hypothetical protein
VGTAAGRVGVPGPAPEGFASAAGRGGSFRPFSGGRVCAARPGFFWYPRWGSPGQTLDQGGYSVLDGWAAQTGGYVHFVATRRCPRSIRGSIRTSAAKTARSAQSSVASGWFCAAREVGSERPASVTAGGFLRAASRVK